MGKPPLPSGTQYAWVGFKSEGIQRGRPAIISCYQLFFTGHISKALAEISKGQFILKQIVTTTRHFICLCNLAFIFL